MKTKENPKLKPQIGHRKKTFPTKVLKFMNYFFVFLVLVAIAVLVYTKAEWGYWVATLGFLGFLFVLLRYNHKMVDAEMGNDHVPPGGFW